MKFLTPRRIDFLLALVCGGALVATQHLAFFQRAEWFAFDEMTQLTAWARPLDPSLLVVAIDDKSIDDLGRAEGIKWAWPWPRSAYADLVAYLRAAGAREIWIDLVFYTPDQMDIIHDDELRAMAKAAGNVRFGQGVGESSKSLFEPTFNVALPATTDGNPVTHGDIKGKRLLGWPAPFNELKNDESRVTSAARWVIEGKNLLKTIDDPTDPAKIAALWARPPPVGSERFKDKIVYVGVTAQAGYDMKAFPVGSREPSVMIHVVTRSNELQNGFFRRLPGWLRALLVLACCLVVSDLFRRVPQFHRYAAGVAVIVGLILAAGYVLFLKHIWVQPMLYAAAAGLTFTVVTSTNYVREGRKRRVTEEMFGKFVSRKIVDRLVARPEQLKLGGEKAELSVMFSDLSGFTTLSENMPSDALLRVLNAYLNEMSELVYEQDGTLDKYIGDAIMAFWGAPDASPDHAWRACHAALACQARLAELAPVWEQTHGVRLAARIGINTDEMTVGMVGSNRLHNYSVIGDAVNLASRLEGANKAFGTSIMIAQRTVDLAQGKIEVRPIALLQVKGKTKPVQVYELLAKAGALDEAGRAAQRFFTEAFAAFLARKWAKAEALLLELLRERTEDGLGKVYLGRVREYMKSPPGPEWDGVFKLDEK